MGEISDLVNKIDNLTGFGLTERKIVTAAFCKIESSAFSIISRRVFSSQDNSRFDSLRHFLVETTKGIF